MDELKLLKNSKENLFWFIKNLPKIKKDYSNQIIAIENKKIIANSNNINQLLIQIDSKGINKEEVLIKQVSSGKEIIIFNEN